MPSSSLLEGGDAEAAMLAAALAASVKEQVRARGSLLFGRIHRWM